MTVIDISGSTSGGPLEAIKNGLRVASQQINPGNYVGLVSYGDQLIWQVLFVITDRWSN